MGRRSINTTKSGKYMNPTDQARKEARKKELKKNKKQRQMVRAAVLKGKDPHQIIEEMEKIDQMEYNVLQPSPLNEKVLKDKRKKLRDTLDRVLKMYNKDDPQKWVELKRSQAEYEKRRNQMITFYESVKHAQSVSVDEIPLPAIQIPEHVHQFNSQPAQIPLPQIAEQQSPPKPASILKRTTAYAMSLDKEPPGVPPGPPPELSDASSDEEGNDNAESQRAKTLRFSDDINNSHSEDDDDDDDDQSMEVSEDQNISSNKPTSLQRRMVALSGQNIDEFMKEMEAVHKNKETIGDKEGEEIRKDKLKEDKEILVPPGTDPHEQQQIMAPSSTGILYRPPPPIHRPVLPLMAMRLPLGPPPGRPNMPPGPPPGLPPRPSIRMPPGPPPGIPPRFIRLPIMPQNNPQSSMNPNVLSAAPQLINRDGKQSATIMAKPQIRNLSADVTRFVPSALRVKREDKKSKNVTRAMLVQELKQQEMSSLKPQNTGTKDDAYKQFMREMEGLL